MSDIHIRSASAQDAADLAWLDNVASHGLSEWVWRQGQADDVDWLALSQAEMASADYPAGWANTLVAEQNGQSLGAACAYVMPTQIDATDMLPVLAPIFDLFKEAGGDWLLDWLAVSPDAQGTGIGGQLLDASLQQARSSSVSRASLVVEDSNRAALALYYSRGFRERDQRRYIPFNKTSKTQNWLLLSAPVT